jgi:hypothetical protein
MEQLLKLFERRCHFQVCSFDDFEYEIYTTAYALAFWEIGFITDDIIEEVKKVIEKGLVLKKIK